MDTLHKGKSIKLHLVDGSPQGLLTAEIMNWTGHVVSASRSKIADLIKRPETSRTGVYFLTGPDPDIAGKHVVYIGESDTVGDRLKQHNKDETKDFWDSACIVTSKDQNLTKAHVRYIESRLISITQNMGRAKLHNANAPDYGSLPEADLADMEYFISQIRLVLPVLGLDFLRERPQVRASSQEETGMISSDNPVFVIQSKKHGLNAEAQEIDGDFIVMAGSDTRKEWAGNAHHSYHQLYDSLVNDGKIVSKGDKVVFIEDISFKSPSAAAAMIFGRVSNGRTAWKVKGTTKTYADWQDEQIEEVT